jgi:hypothetical protein
MMREYEERLSILEGRVVALEDSRAQGPSISSASVVDERMHHVSSRLSRLEMNTTQCSSTSEAGRLPASYVSGPAGRGGGRDAGLAGPGGAARERERPAARGRMRRRQPAASSTDAHALHRPCRA